MHLVFLEVFDFLLCAVTGFVSIMFNADKVKPLSYEGSIKSLWDFYSTQPERGQDLLSGAEWKQLVNR